ncbi:hypothetical protein [Salegentibacter salarius]|uniref:hypothetical protein n=1 Tax=Salegentibacter salarius TaxID=435906 RepID=UPI0009CC418F|nr:hypothetical protein [Salegentibacter salarius]SLK05545.1 hypothetical protein SAMN05660445_03015 [Salegentibacter salarius]
MSDDELSDVLKYSSPDTLYIITWNNLLKKLFCPFQVVVKHQIGELEKGEVVWVNSVKVTAKLKTVFLIKGRAYYYDHFEILDPP